MTHAHRFELLEENPQVELIVPQYAVTNPYLWWFVVFSLRVPHQYLGTVVRFGFDILHLQSNALQEFVLFVACLVRHGHVRTETHVFQVHCKPCHIHGPLPLRRPRVEETIDFSLEKNVKLFIDYRMPLTTELHVE